MKRLFFSLLDYFGVFVSTLCAIHCLAAPLIIVLLPILGASFWLSEDSELVFISVSFLLAFISLTFSYFKRHQDIRPVYYALVGFVLLILAKVLHVEWLEVVLLLFGGAMMVIAHFVNMKMSRRMECKTVNDTTAK